MGEKEDIYYIRRVLGGEPDAFAPLVERYKSLAFNIALRIVNSREDAEDITQDSFVRAYRSLAKFKRESKFSTWLFRIVYNSSVSHIRKKRPEIVSEPAAERVFREEEMKEDGVPGEEDLLVKELQKSLEDLPGEDRALINLYYYQDYSIDEIAVIAGMSHSNVKVRLFRLRKKLHDHLAILRNRELSI